MEELPTSQSSLAKVDGVNYLGRLFVCSILLCFAGRAIAIDHITVRKNKQLNNIEGKTLIEAEDGGVLLLSTDGSLWAVPPDELVERTHDETTFSPLSTAKLSEKLLSQLPADFQVYSTAHYLVCFNTSREYAQWCGSLFERLYRVFQNYWSRKGFQLEEPPFPLVAVIFDDRKAYQTHARDELEGLTDSIVGYYSLQTNRMTMFDLTGLQAGGKTSPRRAISEHIDEILSQPKAERNVATIVHEATHQIAFNCGLHTRYADIPLWVSEGIAVYFEAPDLTSDKGWRSIGSINEVRLRQFLDYLTHRPENSLETLLADDQRFRSRDAALDAYAEAWALNYYLLKMRSKDYVTYLKKLAAKSPLIWDDPETRLAEFESVFGDIRKVDAELLKQVAKMR